MTFFTADDAKMLIAGFVVMMVVGAIGCGIAAAISRQHNDSVQCRLEEHLDRLERDEDGGKK